MQIPTITASIFDKPNHRRPWRLNLIRFWTHGHPQRPKSYILHTPRTSSDEEAVQTGHDFKFLIRLGRLESSFDPPSHTWWILKFWRAWKRWPAFPFVKSIWDIFPSMVAVPKFIRILQEKKQLDSWGSYTWEPWGSYTWERCWAKVGQVEPVPQTLNSSNPKTPNP